MFISNELKDSFLCSQGVFLMQKHWFSGAIKYTLADFFITGHIGLIVVFKTCPHQGSEGGSVAVRYLAPSSHITHQGNIAEVLERCQHNFCSHYSFFGGKFVDKVQCVAGTVYVTDVFITSSTLNHHLKG